MNAEWVISSCTLLVLIMLIRFLFRKRMSPRTRYALWLAAALRLLLPFSFSQTAVSIQNLLPAKEAQGERRIENKGIGEKPAGEEAVNAAATASDAAWSGEDTGTDEKVDEKAASDRDAESERDAEPIRESGGQESKYGQGRQAETESAPEIRKLLRHCWLFGAGLCAVVFLLVNLDYSRRLRRSRKRITAESLPVFSAVPVYAAEMVQTPCLFGLFHPAVYVTKNVTEEEKGFAFVLSHENTHYRHRDNWWALVRILCVCLHWYNPLVWLAAYLSRQDGELACDDRTLKNMGDEARIEYGKTVLALSIVKASGMDGWRISTTMRGSRQQLRERLQMIVHAPERSVAVQLVLWILVPFVLAVTFTGRGRLVEAKQEEALLTTDPIENGHAASDIDAEAQTDTEAEVQADTATEAQRDTKAQTTGTATEAQREIKAQTGTEETPELTPAEPENQQLPEYVEISYSYDENNRRHMERYVEENPSEDAVFQKLDLIYVEDDSIYTLPATTDDNMHLTMIAMAKQALTELYEWTGEKVDTAYFQVSNLGGVTFASSLEDMEHSRIFYSRYFGADTDYNLSGYERAVSTRDIASGRAVWYSPLLWRRFPSSMNDMTDEEVIIWYVERLPGIDGDRVVSLENRYEDIWTIQTASGSWYEVFYNNSLREISGVYGPYPEYPVH